jgi:hypothetical protein
MLVKQDSGLVSPVAPNRINYLPPMLTAFGRVQDLTSAASGATKLGNGHENSHSWQVRS